MISGPRHPDARSIVASGLFDSLSNFRELECRISALPTEGGRGKAFEVFAEAYLATQAIIQAAEVWPFAATPPSIRRRLRLGRTDLGVDGIVRTRLGELQAYQVKFRSARPPLTWTELSTFLGLADYVPHRILFTNCDEIADVLENRRGFYCIRGSDLDRLEAGDFAVLLGWLLHRLVPPPKKTPRSDQHEALDAIINGFAKNDRVTAVMACGTGKTLVQLWSAERLGCRRILVLVPSLALLRQSLHVWLRETRWPVLSYLAVCSDPTVKPVDDPLIVRQGDLDFPVTTDSATVQRFLSHRPNGTQIVFSTYHSAPEVAKGCSPGQVFDLAIFDEAHWTAGREGQRFAFALTDKGLVAQKRLFMTATPRHYNPQRRDKEGDLQLVYSMDRPQIYGPRVYTLPFAEAARRDIICGHQVLISVVTSAMVDEELLRRGEVIVQSDVVKARQVANQIALRKAVEQVGVRKIITFHGSVRSAASFTSAHGEGIRSHLSDFETYHVNGTMRAAERDGFMQEFREAAKAVMSNARCLTEGVDVPAVDMVAFLAPKRSRVDIVQATGRAMRTAAGKTMGYVFLPLFVQEGVGESVEQAIARSDFEEVWNVLQALQEQDEVLEDIIREMREAEGHTGGFADSRFREKVQVLGPAISLDALRQAITTRCVERLAPSWDYMFGKLVGFKERFGHCNVTVRNDPHLGSWVTVQRGLRRRGLLLTERRQRLDALGFEWDPHFAQWEEMYSRLTAYKNREEHCNVTESEDQDLAIWCQVQRRENRTGRLPRERTQQLEKIGFEWDPMSAHWEEMFARLRRYKDQHSSCDVPHTWLEDPELAHWVESQRKAKRHGRLSEDRTRRLEALGFVWEPIDANWEKMFAWLVAYKEINGHCNVIDREDHQLAIWTRGQRQLRKQKRLSKDRIHRLDTLGFEWDPLAAIWEERFSRLLEYKRQKGHCRIAGSEHGQLVIWASHQRKLKREGRLSSDRLERLEAIGFEWDPLSGRLEEMLARLIQFRNQFGHCRVPDKWEEDPQLAAWVGNQRQLKRRGLMSADRIQHLDAIEFVWDPYESHWDEMFALLERFKNTFKHCRVPWPDAALWKTGQGREWSRQRELFNWTRVQRRLWQKDSLPADRAQRLAQLGFAFDPFGANFEERLKGISEYRRLHGHCGVTEQEDPQLAYWTQNIRQLRKQGRLTRERIRRLDEVGFEWNPKRGKRREVRQRHA